MVHAALHRPGTRIYRAVQGTVWGLILLSIGVLAAEALVPVGSALLPFLTIIDPFLRCHATT